MEAIKALGVEIISYLQQSWLSSYAFYIHQSLWFFTPSVILMVVVPLLLAVQGVTLGRVFVNRSLGLAVLWTTIISLRFNTFKQWLLGEDRPYWWVKETPLFSGTGAPEILQYPVTCLSSPSAPTHSLLAGGVGLVLTIAIINIIRSLKISTRRRQPFLEMTVWLVYGALLTFVVMADSFFAQHFLHQAAAAALTGILIAVVILHSDLMRGRSVARTLLINFLLLGTVLGLMYHKEAVGTFNTHQRSAFRWCQNRKWLQIDQTPLMDAFVYTSFALGTSIATSTKYFRKLNKAKFSPAMVGSLAILNLGTCQALVMLPDVASVGSTSKYALYASQTVISLLAPVLCVALIPYFAQAASGGKKIIGANRRKQ